MADMMGFMSILQNITIPENIQPQNITLPPPPKLEGPLAPNSWLSVAGVHAPGRVIGPESMVVSRGYVYTGQADGWVVRVSPRGTVTRLTRLPSRRCGRRGYPACGRPMGMRVTSKGMLLVADAYNGLFAVKPTTGQTVQLLDTKGLVVSGRPVGYVNDLTIARDGTVFFSSSSSRWTLAQEHNILLEADNTGRVLLFDPWEKDKGRQVREIMTNLTFPNGLQLSRDNDFLLVAEGARSRILRAWIGPLSPKRNTLEEFSTNLPGVVDNVRLSPRGTFWVGMSQARHHELPNVLDEYGDDPKLRALLIMMANNGMKMTSPRLGMVVELDSDGQVVRTLQDPHGQRFSSVSEIQEENGVLYFASPAKNYLGFIPLTWLRYESSNETSVLQNPLVVDFLREVSSELLRGTDRRLRAAVLQLIREIILTLHRNSRNLALLAQHQQTVKELQDIISQIPGGDATGGSSGGGSEATTSTVAPSTTTVN